MKSLVGSVLLLRPRPIRASMRAPTTVSTTSIRPVRELPQRPACVGAAKDAGTEWRQPSQHLDKMRSAETEFDLENNRELLDLAQIEREMLAHELHARFLRRGMLAGLQKQEDYRPEDAEARLRSSCPARVNPSLIPTRPSNPMVRDKLWRRSHKRPNFDSTDSEQETPEEDNQALIEGNCENGLVATSIFT